MNTSARGERTREKILAAAGRRLRSLGMAGTTVNEVMRDAGMTHGGFYLHFESKEQLEAAAFSEATRQTRGRWFGGMERTEPERRVERLVKRYLSAEHRDGMAEGCPFASLAGEIAAANSAPMRGAFEAELLQSAGALAGQLERRTEQGQGKGRRRMDRALAILAVCVGGIVMARAVKSRSLSERILKACRTYVMERDG